MWSAEGQSIKIAADAYKQSGLSRDKVFLTQTIYVHSANTNFLPRSGLTDPFSIRLFKSLAVKLP